MTNYTKLAMGEELTSLNNILVEKKLFGLINRAIYLPTGSIINGYKLYISRKCTAILDRLMNLGEETELDAIVKSGNKIEYDPNGCEKLDVCLSNDHNFVALQRFRYKNYLYLKHSDVKIFENETAQKVSELLGL